MEHSVQHTVAGLAVGGTAVVREFDNQGVVLEDVDVHNEDEADRKAAGRAGVRNAGAPALADLGFAGEAREGMYYPVGHRRHGCQCRCCPC